MQTVSNNKCSLFVFQFTPDIASSVPHHKHYALEVTENCSPTIDHCKIKSTSVGKNLDVLYEISEVPLDVFI